MSLVSHPRSLLKVLCNRARKNMAVAMLLFIIVLILAVLVIFVWLLVTLYLYLLRRRYAHIPSPKMPSFYLGHLPLIVERIEVDGKIGELMLDWGRECGPLFVYFVIHHPFVLALKSSDIKDILMSARISKDRKSYDRLSWLFGQRFLGRGLLTIPDYNNWKPRRSLYDPTFKRSYLKSLIPLFNECVDHFLDRLRGLANTLPTVPMATEFGFITLNIIGKVAFGSDFSRIWSDEDLGLKNAKGSGTLGFLISHSLKGSQMSFRNPYYHLFHPHEAEGYRETIRAIRRIGQECILQRFKAIRNNKDSEIPNDILTQIIKIASTSNNVLLEELVDDFATFFIAGQETTALLLSFTLIMIHQNPPVKQRVLDELSEVLGEKTFITAEDMEKLQYLEQVFQEVLRLYPPAPATLREAPDNLDLSGHSIPKGTAILVHFYANHHNPDNWENPQTFDPDRFSPEREKPSPFVYHPFSAGHRSCIGRVFAMMEAKIIMARLLNSFRVNLPKDYKLTILKSTTIRPADDVPCNLDVKYTTK